MELGRPDSYWWDLFWKESPGQSCMLGEERVLADLWRSLLSSRLRPSARMLEVGSGRAWLSKLVAGMSAEKALGMEFTASDLVDLGTRHAADLRAHGIEWDGGVDLCALPYEDDSFDLVCGQWALEYATDRRAAINECRRVLRPGGLVAFVCHHKTLSTRLTLHVPVMQRMIEEGFFEAARTAATSGGVPLAPASSQMLKDVIARMKQRAGAHGFDTNEVVRNFVRICSTIIEKGSEQGATEQGFRDLVERCERLILLDHRLDEMRVSQALDMEDAAAITEQLRAAGLRADFRSTDFCWRVWAEKTDPTT